VELGRFTSFTGNWETLRGDGSERTDRGIKAMQAQLRHSTGKAVEIKQGILLLKRVASFISAASTPACEYKRFTIL
jgi:hypothetical protein